jgi:N-methylhydantoinase A
LSSVDTSLGRPSTGSAEALVVGIDVGGTHTDIVAVDQQGSLQWAAKVPSMPHAPLEAIRNALAGVPRDLPIRLCVNGTTIGINALLQRRLPPVLLVATRGFGDMLYIRRETKANIYDLDWRKPEPLVPRNLTFEIGGRLDAHGREVEALEDPGTLLEWIDASGVQDVAICLIHAYRNPAHEQAVAKAIAEHNPALRVTASSAVWPEWREFERTYNTVLNAALKPVIGDYLTGLVDAVREVAGHEDVYLMHADGGVLSPAEIAERPVLTLLSGTVAGALMGGRAAQTAGFRSAVSLDMGGTSTDLSIAEDGQPTRSSELSIEWEGTLGIAGVDVVSIGSGGGSLVWADEVGGLHVGPGSAGADPGPACAGRPGADAPTLTDAYLLLGYLGPDPAIGGRTLDRELAGRAFAALAEQTGLSGDRLPLGAYEIATADLAAGVRQVTIERGIDPRACALVCFGGAGPVHAAQLISQVGLSGAVIPPRPGNGSALGLMLAPTKHGVSRTFYAGLAELPSEAFWEVVDGLRERALAAMPAATSVSIEWSLALRYRGQTRELTVPLGDGELRAFSDETRDAVATGFHARHEREFTFSAPGEPIQLVSLRCEAGLPVRHWSSFGALSDGLLVPDEPLAQGEMAVTSLDGVEHVAAPVMRRDGLSPGAEVQGPAIVLDEGSTIPIPPGYAGRVDELRNFILTEVSA